MYRIMTITLRNEKGKGKKKMRKTGVVDLGNKEGLINKYRDSFLFLVNYNMPFIHFFPGITFQNKIFIFVKVNLECKNEKTSIVLEEFQKYQF